MEKENKLWIKSPAEIIDFTLLRPDATLGEIKRFLADAKTYKFHTVCLHPWFVPEAVRTLKHASRIKICTVVGFPMGGNTRHTKVFEALEGMRLEVDELDMVMNIGAFKSGEVRYVREELEEIMKNTPQCVHKIILEIGFLSAGEVRTAIDMLNRIKPDFAKTSTGINTRGVTVEDVQILKERLDPEIRIKAAGGIRDYVGLKDLVAAGASRIGTSAGIKIMEAYEKNDA